MKKNYTAPQIRVIPLAPQQGILLEGSLGGESNVQLVKEENPFDNLNW